MAIEKLKQSVLEAAEKVKDAQTTLAQMYFELAKVTSQQSPEWEGVRRAAIRTAIEAGRRDIAANFIHYFLSEPGIRKEFRTELRQLATT